MTDERINQTPQDLQQPDPAVRGSSQEIPKVAQHLMEIIHTTEETTSRVREETEHLFEEQAKVEQGLSRIAETLRRPPGAPHPEWIRTIEELQGILHRSQGRARDILAAVGFQDLTTRKIQELIGLVAEIEEQFLRLLVLLRIEQTVERVPDAKAEGGAKDASALWSQDLIDQLFQEVKGETATSPESSANGTGGDQR